MPNFAIPTIEEASFLFPIFILTIAACIPVTLKVCSKNKEPSNGLSLLFGMGGLFLAAAAVAFLNPEQPYRLVFSGALVFDNLSTFTNLVMILVSALVLFLSYQNVNTKGQGYAEHVFLLLLSLAGMMILVSSGDLMVAFIGLELMSIALYILISIGHEQKLTKEAAFKYFILGSFASALFLYGVAFVFGVTGSTSILTLSAQAQILATTNRLFLTGIVFLLSGILFKVSIFPFHAWAPDVYQGAPTPVTAFMATGVKIAMFTLFLRMATLKIFAGDDSLLLVLQVLAVLTMTVGNVTALVQENVKRMLAYSSIAHAGYILVGIIVACTSLSPDAGSATLFYLLGYSVMNIGALAVVNIFEKENRGNLSVEDYAGLGFKYPFLGCALAVFIFSLAGIPPLVGFIGKFYIFAAAVKEGYIWLAVFGMINSLLSAYYYLRVLVYLYMKEPTHSVGISEQGVTSKVVVATSMALTLLMGIASALFYKPAYQSMLALFS